jgi:hypothetical protein
MLATKNLRPLVFLTILSALYGVLELVPGRFVVTDEVFFKAAGRNWAETGRFAAPEIVGRLTRGPSLAEVYFAQPPVYTFIFGIYTKVFGFGPRRCMLYDTLIHLLLVWTAAGCANCVFKLPLNVAVLCGALFLPLGTIGRPDELAIIFALWGAVALRYSAYAGGVMLGLCAATSLSAPIFLGTLVVWEFYRAASARSSTLLRLSATIGAAAATVAVCVAPILVNHPNAYQQLFSHASEQSPILAAITGNGWNGGRTIGAATGMLLGIWREMMRYGYAYGILIVGLFVFLGIFRMTHGKDASLRFDRVFVGAILLMLLVVVFPGKYFYLWFVASWMLIAAVELAARQVTSEAIRRRYLAAAAGAAMWLVCCIPYIREKTILWTLPVSQSLAANSDQFSSLIPRGAGVVSTAFWWALADRDNVYDSTFSNPTASQIEYIVLSGNGSGKPGVPMNIDARFRIEEFQPIYNHLNSLSASVFERSISKSGYGFGAYVLQRKR